MRLHYFLLTCCCACLAACTSTATKGPDTGVTPPSVGQPSAPASIEAALTQEAFTPYAALGQANNDGLAPDESASALATACITDAGYPNLISDVPMGFRLGGGLAFSQPFGAWGYLGVADAEQYGFEVPAGTAVQSLGLGDEIPSSNPDVQPTLTSAEYAATNKCATIAQDFSDTQEETSLAEIGTLSNDIYTEVLDNADVKTASKAWGACMTKNGYPYTDPVTAWRQELENMHDGKSGGVHINPGQSLTATQNRAQIAMATSEADCTQSTDLAGIYFAVQASYEQQLVNANQQSLTSSVQQYRVAYQKEVSKLPSLLSTTKVVPASTPTRQ
jgi:hypothetical protein